jgi:NADPH:quinone reductase-like Zn-dependent oxidoreductase
MTAACGLYAKLRLPEPWLPATTPIPLVIYGASSAVGYYTIQLALRSNIHPLICVAGNARAHVEKLLDKSKGDAIVDYRHGDDATVQGLKDALQGQKLEYAFDAVSEKGSYQNIGKVLDPSSGRITFVLPNKKYELPEGIEKTITRVGDVHGNPDDLKEFGFVYFRYISKGLAEGWFKAQPQEVVPGGLEGVESGLRNLKEGKASAVKYIFKIADTPGVSQ